MKLKEKFKGEYIDFDSTTDKWSAVMTGLYNNFNRKEFKQEIKCPEGFENWIKLIYKWFKKPAPKIETYKCSEFKFDNNDINKNKVVLGFSGGLDSVYQAVKLLDNGYDVVLYHIRNINKYENGQSYKTAVECFNKLHEKYGSRCDFITKDFHSSNNSLYKKEWPENPVKNQYILSSIFDYCIKNNIRNFSTGDPYNLPIEESTPGINFTDAIEQTKEFLNAIIPYIKGLKEIHMFGDGNKFIEMQELKHANMMDYFYSCVTAGRLNRYFHDKDCLKYNINLPKYNCGTHCRKCATQNLLLYYDGHVEFPQEFIDVCWKRLWNNGYSSEYFQFNPDIPLEQRIKNLHTT